MSKYIIFCLIVFQLHNCSTETKQYLQNWRKYQLQTIAYDARDVFYNMINIHLGQRQKETNLHTYLKTNHYWNNKLVGICRKPEKPTGNQKEINENNWQCPINLFFCYPAKVGMGKLSTQTRILQQSKKQSIRHSLDIYDNT